MNKVIACNEKFLCNKKDMPPSDNFPTYQVFVLSSRDTIDLGYSCTIKFRMNLERRLQMTWPNANHFLGLFFLFTLKCFYTKGKLIMFAILRLHMHLHSRNLGFENTMRFAEFWKLVEVIFKQVGGWSRVPCQILLQRSHILYEFWAVNKQLRNVFENKNYVICGNKI